jgi:hypothetical protein
VVSQSDSILTALERGERLTPRDALDRWGCFRLAARIHELKGRGHSITTRIVKRGDAEVAEYSLVPAGELF